MCLLKYRKTQELVCKLFYSGSQHALVFEAGPYHITQAALSLSAGIRGSHLQLLFLYPGAVVFTILLRGEMRVLFRKLPVGR